MAKQPEHQPAQEMVTIPAELLRRLESRLDTLERAEFARQELTRSPNIKILDEGWEQTKAELSRPAAERSQDIADRKYGTVGKRFRVYLDSTQEDGKPGPDVSEHPKLTISANSDLEAQARYLDLCGIHKHDYRLACEPVAAV